MNITKQEALERIRSILLNCVSLGELKAGNLKEEKKSSELHLFRDMVFNMKESEIDLEVFVATIDRILK